MLRRLTAAIGVIVASAIPSFAADPVVGDPQVVPVNAARFDWSGAYVGAQAGYGHGGMAIDDGSFEADWNVDGMLGGFYAGYNLQSGSVVYGVEGDYLWSHIEGEEPDAGIANNIVGGSLDWLASIRGRLGYAFDNLLLYGTVGYAWGGAEHYQEAAWINAPRGSEDFHVEGVTAGAGLEYAITANWILRAEYRYYHLDGTDSWGPVASGASTYTERAVEIDDLHTVNFGISYKF